jgi:hypothetical protein
MAFVEIKQLNGGISIRGNRINNLLVSVQA